MYSEAYTNYLLEASLDERREDVERLQRAYEARPARAEQRQRQVERSGFVRQPLFAALRRWFAGPPPPFDPAV